MYKDRDTLVKRARHKYLSKGVAIGLLANNPESPLKNSYYGSLLCSHNLYQAGKRVTTSYCKQRWCAVCNRVRTAKLISGYLPVIKNMVDPYFVTLTKQTVDGEQLRDSIDLMEKTWRQILRSDANKKIKIRGIRKAECTIRPKSHYHYHYHVIVDGEDKAKWLINSWLSRLPGVTDSGAQYYTPANETSLKEMFKYFTKLLITDSVGNKEFYPTKRMNIIFTALKGKRTIQPFGGVSAVSEDIDSLVGQIYESLDGADKVWQWRENDWYSPDGEKLTGYEPSEKFKALFARTDMSKTNERL